MSKFKKGDRVRIKRTGVPATVNRVASNFVEAYCNVRFSENSGEFSYADDELELIPKFDFQVGDKVTTPGWSDTPERFVTVEWIGPYQFAGKTHDGKKVVHDFASVSSHWQKWVRTYHFPFKVGDRLQQMYVGAPTCVRPVTVQSVGEPTDRSFETLEGGHGWAKVMGGGYTWELVPEHEVPAPGTSGAHDAATSTSCEPEPAPVHPFKVGDKVRNPINSYLWPATVTRVFFRFGVARLDCENGQGKHWSDSPADVWEHYVEPLPAPVPTVKKWLVTTEERLAKAGDTYIGHPGPKAWRADSDFVHTKSQVITSVQPLTNLNDWIVGGDGK